MGIADEMKMLTQEIVCSYESRITTVGAIINNTHQIIEDFKTKRMEMSNQLKETLANGESLRRKDFDNMMRDIFVYQDNREKEVRDLLNTFWGEQQEMAETIKNNLAEGEKVRKDDFRNTLQNIQVRQKEREDEVHLRLKEFQEEYKEMGSSLHSLLNKGEVIRIKDFKEMLKDIRTRQKERQEEVRASLNGFRKEQEEMASQWRNITNIMAKKRADSLKGGGSKEGVMV